MWWDQIKEWVKGWKYATQPERLAIRNDGALVFHGNHRFHTLTPSANGWICDCETFWRFLPLGGWCRHTRAAGRILMAVDAGTALVCQAELVQ